MKCIIGVAGITAADAGGNLWSRIHHSAHNDKWLSEMGQCCREREQTAPSSVRSIENSPPGISRGVA